MNRIHPDKLHHSKWTAVAPREKEKHFIVVKLIRDDDENVAQVTLESVLTRRHFTLAWRELGDEMVWLTGWR